MSSRRRFAALLLVAAGCGRDAWLGMQCSGAGLRCDDAGAAREDVSTPTEASSATSDTGVAPGNAAADAAVPQDACRSVSMSFFACASGTDMPGAPRLQGGRAYTLRLRGAYEVDTTFQVQGSTSACSPRMFGNITLLAGEAAAEHCLTPSEDVALLLTVVSGDVQVWMENGVQAELCDGCE